MQVITNEQIIQKIKQGEEINANRLLLWEHNQTVIKTVLKPFCAFYEVQDLLQECYIIMQNAVDNYSLDSDYKFTTYLTNSIRWQMPRILTRLKGFCLPSTLDKPYNEYRHLIAKYGDISDKQASEMLNISDKQLKTIKRYIAFSNATSLDKPTEDENDTLANIIPDSTNIAEQYEEQNENATAYGLYNIAQQRLKPKEYLIISEYYKEQTPTNKIAKQLNISDTRVHQYRRQALRQLQRDNKIIQLASEMHYKTDIAYKYGYNAWRYNGTSAVEKSFEECENINERIQLLRQQIKREYAQ